MTIAGRSQHGAKRAAGATYIIVLSSAVIVTVIGLSALLAVRVQRQAAEAGTDMVDARLYAEAAVDWGLLAIRQNDTWRTTFPNGVWIADRPVGQGAFTLEGIDPEDGDLTDSPTDPLILIGTGVKGTARHRIEVRLAAKLPPLDCLSVAVQAGNDVVFGDRVVVRCDQIISANDDVRAGHTCKIYADVEAVDQVRGRGYMGSITTGIAPRAMPAEDAFDYYLDNGVHIDVEAIPELDGKRTIQQVVLSPANNPFGTDTSREGIYVIDCRGRDIVITEARLVATLLLLNPGRDSRICGSINWEPAVPNYPALMVSGDISLQLREWELVEGAPNNTNFNPPGTPYRGVADMDKDDFYPSRIRGLLYVSGDLTVSESTRIDGVAIAGRNCRVANDSTFRLRYRDTAYKAPPPGFTAAPEMYVVAGSWRQLTD